MITINVEYEASEYRNTLREFVPVMWVNRKTGHWPDKKLKASFWTKIMIYCLGSVAFFWKLRKVGSCIFHINETEITRESKLGKKTISWDEVLNIHVMSSGYLLEISQGAMPLPYRCFSGHQKNEFEKMVFSKLRTYESEES